MKRFAILLSRRAATEIDAAKAWRTQHGAGAPEAIDDEIAASFRRLEVLPGIGPRWSASPDVRRLSLGRIGYHLYYRVDTRTQRITVVCFWHQRRRPPRL